MENKVEILATGSEVKVKFIYKNKEYQEEWFQKEQGVYTTKEKGIEDQLIDAGIADEIPEDLWDTICGSFMPSSLLSGLRDSE